MPTIEPRSEGPINDLFLAINHYVSTGDHIGEGVALPEPDGRVLIQIPYDPRNATDAEDFKKFASRMAEIAVADPALKYPVRELGKTPQFAIAGFTIAENKMRRLAKELVRGGGMGGFGSPKGLIDQNFPDARGMLLSEEGV